MITSNEPGKAREDGQEHMAGADLKPQPQKDDQLLFGPEHVGEAAYKRYAALEPNQDPFYAIEDIRQGFSQPAAQSDKSLEARGDLWKNYGTLEAALSADKDADPVTLVNETVSKIHPSIAADLGPQRARLGLHLQEVCEFSADLFLNAQGGSRFPELTDKQARLMVEVVAPMHDVLKYLTKPSGQVLADHRVLAAELVLNHFDKRTVGSGPNALELQPEDLEFIAEVIGRHENIYEEKGRRDWIDSTDRGLGAARRAAAMFLVADVLTKSLVPNERGGFEFDNKQLDIRFVDLVIRHIDPVLGKLPRPRPEWIEHTVKDLAHTLEVLRRTSAIDAAPPDKSVTQTLARAAIRGIDCTLSADDKRPVKLLDADARKEINKVRDALLPLASL